MKCKYYFIILLLAFVPLMTQCTSSKSAATAAGEALVFGKEQVWQLVAMRGKEVPAQDDPVIFMLHPESGTLRGRIACNRYFADYTLRLKDVTHEGTRYIIKMTDLSSGDVQCPEGDMAVQERYLALLEKADACLLTPYTLTLFRGGKETLKFELQ